MRKIGYIRVSTGEQRPDRQIDGLEAICDELHVEKLSAASRSRPVYERVIAGLEPGDVFVIWDLDRAYRSARDALNELDKLQKRNVSILIANMNLDTTTPYGMLIYTVIGGLAEFERRLLSQRTKEGLVAARKRGKRLGRPPKLAKWQLRAAAARLRNSDDSMATVAAHFGVAPWTLARALKRSKINTAVSGAPRE